MLKSRLKKILILNFCIIFFLIGCDTSNNNSNNKSIKTNSYKQAEFGYEQILLKYKEIINGIISSNFEAEFNKGNEIFSSPDQKFEYEWSCMVIDATQEFDNPNVSSFGYILKDIDSNGIDELFLVRKDYTILAIFTLFDNQPILLGAYWSRNKCILLDSGELYILESSGAQNFEYSIQRIARDGQKLIKVKQFGMDNDNYYESLNDQIVKINSFRFEELLTIFPYNLEENQFSLDKIKTY